MNAQELMTMLIIMMILSAMYEVEENEVEDVECEILA